MAEFKHKMGCLVRLHGLNNAAYNGRFGEVFDVDSSGRLTVQLRDEAQVRTSLLHYIKIKPENMLSACSHCLKTGGKMQFCGKCRVAG